MAKTFNLPMNANFNMQNMVILAEQQLRAQGYETSSAVMSAANATITVSKDRDGIKNFMGLGIECTVNITVMGNGMLTVNVESEWTNKIVALIVGWFLCWIPCVTGIIGCVNQSSLPNKVTMALQSSVASL